MYFDNGFDMIWQLVDPGTEFLPSRVFGVGQYIHRADPLTPPAGYAATHRHWFGVWEETEGIWQIDAFYPVSATEGERIAVVIDCPFCGVSVRPWVHGEPGLAHHIDADGHLEGWCSPDPRHHTPYHHTPEALAEFYRDLVAGMVAAGTPAADVRYAEKLEREAVL